MNKIDPIAVTQIWPAGADPENLHGRWLAGLLPIVNHTGAKGWLINNGYTTCMLHKRTGEGGG